MLIDNRKIVGLTPIAVMKKRIASSMFVTHSRKVAVLVFLGLLATIWSCAEGSSRDSTVVAQNRESHARPVEPMSTPSPTPQGKRRETDIDRNRRRWRSTGLQDYDLKASLYVGGVKAWPEPVSIKVRNGVATSIVPLPQSLDASVDGYREFATVEKMFDLIENETALGARVKVKYNVKAGYPKEIYIDYPLKGSDRYRRLVVRELKAAAATPNLN